MAKGILLVGIAIVVIVAWAFFLLPKNPKTPEQSTSSPLGQNQVATGSATPTITPPPKQVFQNEAFSFAYPHDWQLTQQKTNDVVTGLIKPKTANDQKRQITFSIAPILSSGASVDEKVAVYTVLGYSRSSIQVGGVSADQMTGTSPKKKLPMMQEQVVFIKHKGLIITLAFEYAAPTPIPANETVFKDFLKSIVLR